MKYLLLFVLCAWLVYEIFVFIKVLIAKRKMKRKVDDIVESVNVEYEKVFGKKDVGLSCSAQVDDVDADDTTSVINSDKK